MPNNSLTLVGDASIVAHDVTAIMRFPSELHSEEFRIDHGVNAIGEAEYI